MRRARPIYLVLLAALAAACGSRSARVVEPDRGAWADELVRQGCYDCLLDARAAYERLAGSSAAALARVFEVDLLLALREKELSIDPTATLAHAASLVPRLTGPGPPGPPGPPNRLRPVGSQRDPTSSADSSVRSADRRGGQEGGHYVLQAERLLAIVRTVPEDAAGRRVLPPTKDAAQQIDEALAAIDVSPFSAELNDYLRLTIQCGRTPADRLPPANVIPLLAYRRAICTPPFLFDRLRAVRTAVPRFVETSFFLGRVAMAAIFRTDGSEVRGFFEHAYARFSNSPTIAFDLGTVYQATNECRPAERLFTRVLELKPAHEEGRLGRAVCRTYLSQNEGAVADATVLIEARASNRGEAYYWRAWNRRHLKQIEAARADIDQARALRYNARVLTLAGMIEYDQREYEIARRDLTQARDLDPRECDAPWYLGLVEVAVESWPPGARAFVGAAQCYEALLKETEKFRADMAARTDVSEEFRKRQLAGFDAAIADDNVRKSAAELNAAINFGRAGDIPNATVYMKRAAVDPERRTAVEDLRQVLGVPRW